MFRLASPPPPPPSPAFLLLRTTSTRRPDPDALLHALSAALARPGAHWAGRNLLDEAIDLQLPPRVLALLLADFRRASTLRAAGELPAHDREALVSAVRALPHSPQAALLLASVPLRPREEPQLPLRVLLAAARSRSERWALGVLHHHSKLVLAAVRSAAVRSAAVSSPGHKGPGGSADLLAETTHEAVRGDMGELLRELLALNRPVVEAAAAAWVRRMGHIRRSALEGGRVGGLASARLDNAAGAAARALVAAAERREAWQRVKLILMERRRLERRPVERSERRRSWLGLHGVQRRLRRRTEPGREQEGSASTHAIMALPDALLGVVVSFLASTRPEGCF